MLIRQTRGCWAFYSVAPAALDLKRGPALMRGRHLEGRGSDASAPAKIDAAFRPWGLMLPHAGYVYCGRVLGATLAGVELPRTLIVLCPNHTGRGQTLGVWPEGAWLTPLAPLPVDAIRPPPGKGRRQWRLRGGHAFPSGGARR